MISYINTLDTISLITNSHILLYYVHCHYSYHRRSSRSHVVIVVVIIVAVIMITSSSLLSLPSSLRRYRYHTSSDGGGLGRGHGRWYLTVTQEGPQPEQGGWSID